MSDAPDMNDDDALAAEYVLHLLDPAEVDAFEGRLASDPALRARVTRWEAHFAPMAEALTDIEPSPRIKTALMADIASSRPARRWGWGWLALPSVLAMAAAAFFFLSPFLWAPIFDPILHASLASEDGS